MEDDFTNSTRRHARGNRHHHRPGQQPRSQRFDLSPPSRAFSPATAATNSNSAALGVTQINSEIPDLLVDSSDSDSDSMYEVDGAVGGGARERGVATLKHTCCRYIMIFLIFLQNFLNV